jgi:acyl-CoA synthetase (AMP-forming)/AMP-acid ligase II
VFRKTAAGWAIPGPRDEPAKVFAAMPFFWVGGLITIAAALQQGLTLVCLEHFEMGEALDLIERERVSALSAWHGLIQAMREHPTIPHRDLSSIPMLTNQDGGRGPFGAPLGMTETIGPHLELSHPTGATTLPEHLRGSNGSSGPYFDHKLVDPDTGRELGDGEEGEICVRGYAVAAGMYKRERHEVFDDDGYYHTGDRCRLEDGLYFFTGRVTEMIKTRGSNVAPLEVEAVLESFPEVWMAFVVGIPDAARDEQVVAVVVPVHGVTIDPTDLRERVRLELSNYKVPRLIVSMTEDEVPWLATGKVDKRTLKELLASATTRG